MDDQRCKTCGVPRTEHFVKEAAGEIKHSHTLTGQLVRSTLTDSPQSGSTETSPLNRVNIMVAPAPDLALRRLLVDLGVVTQAQLDAMVELSNTLDLGRPAT